MIKSFGSDRFTSNFFKTCLAFSYGALLCGLLACGAEEDDKSTTIYLGTLLSKTGEPVASIQASLFETGESTTTDDAGEFIIESFKHFSSVGFFFEAERFTNTVRIDNIPEDAPFVNLMFIYDPQTQQVTLSSIDFSNMAPTPTPEAVQTPDSTGTPIEEEGNFDANGNTTAFGIPRGLTGNIKRGQSLWSGTCHECHAREKSNRSYADIQTALRRVSAMRRLGISNQQAADAVAYLNRGRN